MPVISSSHDPKPRVDVGIVTWNTAELTAQAIRRLLDSTTDCDLRVLVHDNASTDGTPQRLAEDVPEAQVEVSPHNLGFAKGVNRLLSRSTAPWFLALNSDAWPEPGAVARLVVSAQSNPRAAVVAPLLLRPDGSVEHSTHPFPSLKLAMLDALGGRHWLPKGFQRQNLLEPAWKHDHARPVDWAVGAALLMRRDAIDQIGGFDERFFMYVEDLEWCWRARQRGWEIHFDPEAVVIHVGGASGNRRFGDTRVALEVANLATFVRGALGPGRGAAFQAIQALACGAQVGLARVRSQPDEYAYWKTWLKANLGLTPLPFVGRIEDPKGGPHRNDKPKVSVVIPTHGRPQRLTRLVRALEDQTLAAADFEVVIVDDASPDDTAEVLKKLATHTLLDLKVIRQPIRSGPAAARNRAWRMARGPVIAFTDDDCVPDPGWLQAGLAALGQHRRMAVGRTEPPPDQIELASEPFSRVMHVDSARFFETCNAFYRRVDLEAVGGFDERFARPSGEDTHLGLKVIGNGIEAIFADEALVLHDVRPGSFTNTLRETSRWVDLPLVLKGRREARAGRAHRLIFWKATHPPAILAACGLALGIRFKPALVLIMPWLRHRSVVDPTCQDPLRRITTLPGALVVDLYEVGIMAKGSWRHRALLL